MSKKKGGKGLSPKQIDDIEQDYGLAYALFKAFPELNDLLQKAVKNTWTPARFQTELRQTKWFEKHSDVWRKTTALKYSDPQTYHKRMLDNASAYKGIASSMGVNLSQNRLRALAERGLLFGWTEDQVKDVLSRYIKPSNGEYGGSLAASQDNLSKLAYQNGVHINGHTMQNWMKSIARGDGSEEQFSNYIKRQAASTFSLYGDQIKNGATMYDIANPYINTMAQTLELNPNEIDLFDPTIRKALSGTRNDKGQLEPVSMTDFEDSLRQDRRWQYTDTANEQARGYVRSLSQMWGLSG